MRNPKTSEYIEDMDEEDDVPYDEEEEVEENDDDVDEEEDEDDDPRPRKRTANPFIDEMALVDEDEEEEEEEEDYGREDGFIDEEPEEVPSDASMQRRHLDLDRRRREMEGMDDEQVAAFYAQKYGGRRPQTFKSSEEVPQQLLLPSVNDPNLWMVKCKPGKEKDIVLGMMKRYFDRLYSDVPLDTFSSFARESLKGYVYIEARRLAHVQQAIANIPHVYQTTLMLVPIQDMVDSINVQKKATEIPVGGWVRVTRGTYNGDLAKVLEVSDSQDTALVKLIPRLALDQEEDDYKLNNNRSTIDNTHELNAPAATDDENNKKRKKPATVRPPQRLFNPERLSKRHIANLQKKGPYWVLNNDSFRDGYLEKNVKVTSLQIEDVSPSLEEITRFIGDSVNGEDADRALDLSAASLQAVNDAQATSLLQPGDRVEVIEGDMIHSIGTLESVNDGSVRVTLDMGGFKKAVTLAAKQVRKKFSEGDHVKVVHGLRKDESGMVVKVEGNVITIVSDSSLEEVKVFGKDLRVAAEITLGKTSIGNYELHDLVQLDFHTVGIIVKVDKNTFKVMTQNGDIRTMSPHQITNKRNTQNAVATDANGHSIAAGDTVMEVRGERRTCTVLHIYRQQVFLHSRENMANYGVWVENTRSVVSMSPKDRQTPRDNNMRQPHNGQNFRGGFDGRGRGRGGAGAGGAAGRGGFFGRGRGGRDNLISKTVRVTQGPHKGYVGIVKDATDSMARVELHTNSKVINVDKAKLVLIGVKGETVGPVLDGNSHHQQRQDSYSSRAPMTPNKRYGDGGMTPRHYASGSQTPAWNMSSRTPNPYANNSSSDGSKTPAWDLGSKTPNPYASRNNDGSKTPAWDSGSKTPSWKAETPRWNSSGGRTPGFNDYGDRSPTWSGSNSRYADRDVAPTPAAHNLAPATPVASSNNVAPSPAPFPQTPGAGFPQTPYESAPTPYDGAPTPGANLAPATPAALTAPTPAAHMLSAPTPGGYIPSTPAGSVQPQTPFRPTGGDYGHIEEQAEDTSDWPIEEIEVKVTRSGDGAQQGQLASILSVNSSSRTCSVTLNDSGSRIELPFDNIEPVRPSKKDPVKVLLGQHRGGIGALIGVDGHDGILRLKGQGTAFKFVSINHVGKYTGSEISNGVV